MSVYVLFIPPSSIVFQVSILWLLASFVFPPLVFTLKFRTKTEMEEEQEVNVTVENSSDSSSSDDDSSSDEDTGWAQQKDFITLPQISNIKYLEISIGILNSCKLGSPLHRSSFFSSG